MFGIKPVYSNPYRPQGNSKLENVHNILKHTISTFLHNNMLEWDHILPIATYIYNIALSVNNLKSPFFLVFGQRSTQWQTKSSPKLLRVPMDGAKTAGSRQTQMDVEAACRTTS